eukprot:TRINITY_DN932_c0_g1_i1.p1 TRINITY_DN932_c0_g1~~TRINITY_DN932_c0_g1_i1.p1  ORF type:complete len:277 (+),score=51.10 TRINITY_DN932_c0_g1_i1:46-876(+)
MDRFLDYFDYSTILDLSDEDEGHDRNRFDITCSSSVFQSGRNPFQRSSDYSLLECSQEVDDEEHLSFDPISSSDSHQGMVSVRNPFAFATKDMEIESLKKDNTRLRRIIADDQHRIIDLESYVRDIEKENWDLHEEKITMKRNFVKQSRKQHNMIEELQNEIRDLSENILKLEMEKDDLYDEINRMNAINKPQLIVEDRIVDKLTQRLSMQYEGIIDSMKSRRSHSSWCTICMENEKTHACFPCGHLTYCAKCINYFTDTCPICRERITSIIKIYT